ncbi:acyl-CoA reductase-like NAD-dependent aldehyde dehydrogenase [Rhizobium sp. BK313]|uniref:aldehyde dehydrogenase family protein n=1 Tax=Rhizobium sp. BK313 TaxID=2587081 RepID=UPI001061079B|nr:aldehyde dehydrogenase family protein [Rhizobium sp. BK313]MBB3455051.1 acyl-CoA reductase-like NAD-dependent aldehyde dehydrogenase [Rhizobium sp. BK313]
MTAHYRFIAPRLDDPRLLGDRRYSMLIGGASVPALSGETITRESPAHPGHIVSTIPKGSRADAERAIAAARAAFDSGPWPRMTGAERSRIMYRIGESIEANIEELATIEALEVGKAISQARGEMGYSAELWRYAAGQARGLEGETYNDLGTNTLGLVLREPAGVVGIITPWNFPLLIGSERIPWAIGAGCTVVIKPSEFTSGSTIRMAELAREAGLPDGVLNVVTGYGADVGQVFAEHPDVDAVNFTGSQRVGRVIGSLAGQNIKRVGLELGGKGPQVVFSDADLDAAAAKISGGAFHCSGQACIAGSRLIVADSIADKLLEKVEALAAKIVTGDPLNDASNVGALIHHAHFEKVAGYVEEGKADGATIYSGGTRLGEAGAFFAPTIFTGVKPEMSIARDEIFGPVLSTFRFSDPEEAIALANDTPFGLSACVWTNNLSTGLQAIRRIKAGRTWINGMGDGTPQMPIGGYKQSGIGRELGRHGFDEYSELKNIHVTLTR